MPGVSRKERWPASVRALAVYREQRKLPRRMSVYFLRLCTKGELRTLASLYDLLMRNRSLSTNEPAFRNLEEFHRNRHQLIQSERRRRRFIE